MPFVGKKRQKEIDNGATLTKVGDLCHVVYKPMIEYYTEDPSWTICHLVKNKVKRKTEYLLLLDGYPIAEDITQEDKETAIDLAWDVFCALYVIPHEQYKRNTNGDVLC